MVALATTAPPVCKHCSRSKVNRPRGLCWSCYYTPGVKEMYPSTSKYARRGVGNRTGVRPLPPFPTTAGPGTPEKMAVLEERARDGFALWHPHDADETGVPAGVQVNGRGRRTAVTPTRTPAASESPEFSR